MRVFPNAHHFISTGPAVQMYACLGNSNQQWAYNSDARTLSTIFNLCLTLIPNRLEVWAGPLAGGAYAVALFNRLEWTSANITVNWQQLGLAVGVSASVRDVYAQKDLGVFTSSFTSPVPVVPHGVLLVKITPVQK